VLQRDGEDALMVNWFEIEIINAKDLTTYHNSSDTIVERAACGRARPPPPP